MHEVLRAAVAEVEQYSRVKVVPPIEGTLLGGAVTDVIHLVAELIENATKFSAPHTPALVRAQSVTAGLVIEVEDRGLGMLPDDQQRMNDLLADPAQVDVAELLRDGRIGLFVVGTLARRHGIRVQLQGNIYGGIQAVVVMPRALIEPAPVPARPDRVAREASDFSSPQQRQPRAVPDVPPASFGSPAAAGTLDPAMAPTMSPGRRGTPAGARPPAQAAPAAAPPLAATAAPPAAEAQVPVISGTIVKPPVTQDGTLFDRSAPARTGWATMAAESRYAPAGQPPWEAAPPPPSAQPQWAQVPSPPPVSPEPSAQPQWAQVPSPPPVSPEPSAQPQWAQVPSPPSPSPSAPPPSARYDAGSGWAPLAPQPPSRPAPPSPAGEAPPASPAPPGPPARHAEPAGPRAGTPLAAPVGPPGVGRPSLPVRRGQTHMAPELRDGQRSRRDSPAEDHIPGLMADFRRGISRAAEEDSPPGTDSPR
jgi:hypothetical protein